MITIEIRAGVLTGDTNIHTFIHIIHEDGTEEAWGFYPKESSLENYISGDGEVRGDLKTDYNSSSGQIPITQEQYDALKDYINETTANPPPYSIPYSSHCTTWALDAITQAGISPDFLSPGMVPDNFLVDIVQTMIWNPLTEYIGFSVYEFFQSALNWVHDQGAGSLERILKV